VRKEDVVSRNPKVMNGALVFSGTRVPVEILIQHLAAGDSLEDILEGFPSVSREQAVAYLEMTPEAVDALIQTNTVLQMKDQGIEFRMV
jgi:uncharacterized protein (DUF433 family)